MQKISCAFEIINHIFSMGVSVAKGTVGPGSRIHIWLLQMTFLYMTFYLQLFVIRIVSLPLSVGHVCVCVCV